MIDYLTLILDLKDYEHLWERVSRYARNHWQIQKWNPVTGEVEWSQPCRESVRSDTHQITLQVSPSRVKVSGSPARAMGLPNNVFGSDDLIECGRAHIDFARRVLSDLALPGLPAWKIARVDKTYNYAFGSAAEVRQALAYLGQFDGGRYKADTRHGDTAYWSPGSNLRSSKAYLKGLHLLYQIRKGQASAEPWQVELANRLLRLELQLGSAWWNRRRKEPGFRQWSVDLYAEYQGYWSGLIGSVEVCEMSDLELFKKVAKTEGQALSAYRTWCLIKQIGHRAAMESMPRRTWYNHKKILNDAGLGWGDIATGQIVPFRRRALVMEQPVTSWEELKRLAAA
ncbi:phage/plasmid replication protein, II/X family [Thiocystis violacea]|uniref:phage/plasmid replication protein, II/X family n=1 Tax=Thiocystis violacea TaxID=13725 RepID=UPI0019062B7F|nr:phage/plasmid replication protein, II/X family [Thiocystis violacea]MBK1718521.1 hypothetical protein [Thiocystis violacea]